MSELNTTEKLRAYVEIREDILLAFIFGSRAKGLSRPSSDWDIAVYLAPRQWGELETRRSYPGESEIRADVERAITETSEEVSCRSAIRIISAGATDPRMKGIC